MPTYYIFYTYVAADDGAMHDFIANDFARAMPRAEADVLP